MALLLRFRVMNRRGHWQSWILLAWILNGVHLKSANSPVYDVNAVGYVNTTLVPGFNLVSNPLNNTLGNNIQNLFGTGIQGTIPNGLTVYILETNGYRLTTFNAELQRFEPESVAAEQMPPGRGFFVYNPGPTLTITFVGEILQGVLSLPLPEGFSIVGSMVPWTKSLDQMGFPGGFGDYVYYFNPVTQQFEVGIFDDLDGSWLPRLRPVQTGEAFIVFKRKPAVWTLTFSINQP